MDNLRFNCSVLFTLRSSFFMKILPRSYTDFSKLHRFSNDIFRIVNDLVDLYWYRMFLLGIITFEYVDSRFLKPSIFRTFPELHLNVIFFPSVEHCKFSPDFSNCWLFKPIFVFPGGLKTLLAAYRLLTCLYVSEISETIISFSDVPHSSQVQRVYRKITWYNNHEGANLSFHMNQEIKQGLLITVARCWYFIRNQTFSALSNVFR